MTLLHVFDMDGTLLPNTTASMQIALVQGGERWLHDLEEQFRNGLLDTKGFAAELHRGWSALTPDDVARAFQQAPKLTGIRHTVEDIHARGDVAVVLSMSPDFFVDHWLQYGFDVAVGSRFPALPFRAPLDPAGILTFEDKPTIVERLRVRYGVDARHVVAYGDSESDVPLFKVAGRSVAVNADHHVRDLASVHYLGDDLFAAYQLGLADIPQ